MGRRRRRSDRTAGILDQVRAESEAMAKYALASGLAVPTSVLEVVVRSDTSPTTPEAGASEPTDKVATDLQVDNVRRLAAAHDHLARIVAPATPRTILLLSQERAKTRLAFLGPVRLVRHLMAVAIVLLATFVATAMSPDVNDSGGDIFRSSGWELLVNELFLLSAAGIGAAFTALFRANRYIANGTYDPKYESSYWVRFILGLIAGIVLPALIPIEGGRAFTRPLLALLGGFSASVFYRILSRLVDTLESLFQGDGRDMVVAREQELKVRAAEQRLQDQLRLAAALTKLREQLDAGSGTDQLKASVARLIDELAPFGPEPSGDGPPEPPQGERPRPVIVS